MDLTVLGDMEKKTAISAYDAPSSRIFNIACLVLGSIMLPPFVALFVCDYSYIALFGVLVRLAQLSQQDGHFLFPV